MLADAVEVLGGDRPAAICREITKKFEETRRDTLANLAAGTAGEALKGEIVVIIGRGESGNVKELDLDRALQQALDGESVRDAADRVAAELGLPRRMVYQRALQLAAKE
jgi:16S rRNA (cytidine1402-2'-O)-methyltransferase